MSSVICRVDPVEQGLEYVWFSETLVHTMPDPIDIIPPNEIWQGDLSQPHDGIFWVGLTNP